MYASATIGNQSGKGFAAKEKKEKRWGNKERVKGDPTCLSQWRQPRA